MRSAVIILSLIGALAAFLLGGIWVAEQRSSLAELAPYRAVIELNAELAAGLDALETRLRAGIALLVAGVLGLLGTLLVVRHRTRWAAVPLFVGGLGPVLFEPEAAIFTFLLVLAGVVALATRLRAPGETSFWRASSRQPHA